MDTESFEERQTKSDTKGQTGETQVRPLALSLPLSPSFAPRPPFLSLEKKESE